MEEEDIVKLVSMQEDLRKAKKNLLKKEREFLSKKTSLKNSTLSKERRKVIASEIKNTTNDISNLKSSISTLQNSIVSMVSGLNVRNFESTQLPIMSVSRPILLFPVRLETKFKEVGSQRNKETELWIRIYPDEISIQTHENNLTEDEYEAGCLYVNRIWWAGSDETDPRKDERKERRDSAWKELAGMYGPQRAAWIIRKFLFIEGEDNEESKEKKYVENYPEDFPSLFIELDEYGNPEENEFEKPQFKEKEEIDFRPESWSEPPRSYIMPDFFVVRLYRENNLVCQKSGNLIPTPLNIVRSPFPVEIEEDEGEVVEEDEVEVEQEDEENLLFFDEESKWVIDFNEAVEKGMAIKIDSEDVPDLENGFSRIIAIGIKSSADHSESQKLLKDLIQAHRFTEGFGLIHQGTPTNNVAGVESGYSRQIDYEKYYQTEFGNNVITQDANRLARAIGVEPSLFKNIENACKEESVEDEKKENENAKHMIKALWSITFGYYLKIMLNRNPFNLWYIGKDEGENIKSSIIEGTKNHYIEFVRGRGPFPAIRIGDNPYGILPTTSMRKWIPSTLDSIWATEKSKYESDIALNGFLPKVIRKLIPLWKEMAEDVYKVPRAGGHDDPDAELINILGMGASSQNALIRPYVSVIYLWNLHWFLQHHFYGYVPDFLKPLLRALGLPSDSAGIKAWWDNYEDTRQKYRDKFSELHAEDNDFPDLNPFLLNIIPWESGYKLWDFRRFLYKFKAIEFPMTPFIQAEPLSEIDPLVTDYIKWLFDRKESLDDIEHGDHPSDSLLYNLLRLAILISNNHYAFDSLDYLKSLPSAELERLLGETLDLYTNRLDALITSISSKRLHNLRNQYQDGIYLGAYGWVENLYKDSQGRVKKGGYIFAPSHDQAVAGAILRNAYLSHNDREEKDLLAVKLSSDRVQKALWLLNGIREGQSLSVLLGYRFEKGLMENFFEKYDKLGSYIYRFRELYPLELKEESETEEDDSKEVVVPRNVVDGLKLLKAWNAWKNNEEEAIPFNDDDKLPRKSSNEYKAIEIELDCIDDAFDAINDLGLFESIYHNVRGNYDRAPVLLDILAGGGGNVPVPESVFTPHSGFSFKHRFIVLCTSSVIPAEDPWYSNESPRAKAAPQLTKWVAAMLGDLDKYSCKYSYESIADDHENLYISLKDLSKNLDEEGQDIGPLDLLFMSTTEIGGGATELEQRILYKIRADNELLIDEEINIEFEVSSEWSEPDSRSILEIVPLAKRLQKFISNARFLEPSDLYLPEYAEDNPSAAFSANVYGDPNVEIEGSLHSIANHIKQKVEEVVGENKLGKENANASEIREYLLEASHYGIKNSIPVSGYGEDDTTKKLLQEQAADVKKELEKRLEKCTKSITDANTLFSNYKNSSEIEEEKDHDKLRQALLKIIEGVRDIFGKSFVILPMFKINNGEKLREAFSDLDDEDTAIPWLQKTAHTHPKLKKFEDIIMLSEALSTGVSLELDVGQLQTEEPLPPEEVPPPRYRRWLALPFGEDSTEKYQGSLSLVVFSPIKSLTKIFDEDDPSELEVSGLVVDEWDEIIPNKIVNSAIAYHYNRPNTEAPQTLLLAVPPMILPKIEVRFLASDTERHSTSGSSDVTDNNSSSNNSTPVGTTLFDSSSTLDVWNFDYLAESVEEAFDLAKIRAIDLDSLVEVGHFLPALFVPTNPGGDEE